MMAKSGIVCFLSSEWSHYHRPGLLRAVARASSGQHPVLVIDNPVCLATSRWQRPQRWHRWRERAHGSTRLSPVADNLFLLDTAVALHDKLAVLGRGWINRRMLSAQVQMAMRELDISRPLVAWFQYPTQQHYVGMLNEELSLYECYDEHSDVPGLSGFGRRRMVVLEQLLMQACGSVVTTSKPLFEARSAQHSNVALIYNGADLDLFAPVGEDSLRRVTERCSQPPTIGYLGTMHQHTDLAMLAEVVRRRPGWCFVLIGPVQAGADETSLAALRGFSNVEMHGWVDDADLVALLCRFDVGVIPYRSDARFNRFVNPNKLHEYTAMGKPVVASPGLDMSSHGDMVTVARGADEFIAAVEAVHAQNTVRKVEGRLRTAAANSWDARARLLLQQIARTLDRSDAAVAVSASEAVRPRA